MMRIARVLGGVSWKDCGPTAATTAQIDARVFDSVQALYREHGEDGAGFSEFRHVPGNQFRRGAKRNVTRPFQLSQNEPMAGMRRQTAERSYNNR